MDDVEQVIALERSLLSPSVRRDPETVGRLLHEDFTEIGASGRLWSRRETVEALAAEAGGTDEAVPDAEMTADAVAPDVILLTYVSDPGGRRARRSSLWRRTSDGWRLRHHQGTLSDR